MNDGYICNHTHTHKARPFALINVVWRLLSPLFYTHLRQVVLAVIVKRIHILFVVTDTFTLILSYNNIHVNNNACIREKRLVGGACVCVCVCAAIVYTRIKCVARERVRRQLIKNVSARDNNSSSSSRDGETVRRRRRPDAALSTTATDRALNRRARLLRSTKNDGEDEYETTATAERSRWDATEQVSTGISRSVVAANHRHCARRVEPR